MGKWRHEHKPIWTSGLDWLVTSEDGEVVCRCDDESQAAQIVSEHNAHESLVEACKWASSWMESFASPGPTCQNECDEIMVMIDAALAQAGEPN